MTDNTEMMANFASAEVSYNAGDVQLGSLGDNTSDLLYRPSVTGIDWNWYNTWWQPTIVKEYYPSYTTTMVREEDKFKKAFSVAKLLLKKKILNSRKLPDFIQLVEMIAEEI